MLKFNCTFSFPPSKPPSLGLVSNCSENEIFPLFQNWSTPFNSFLVNCLLIHAASHSKLNGSLSGAGISMRGPNLIFCLPSLQ